MKKYKIKILQKKDFPTLLKQIPDPPKKLFYRGNIKLLYKQCISIVGTRKITSYGEYVLQQLIPKLTEKLIIVSGLAIGTDAFVHKLTLENNGLTIAIPGGGLHENFIYPQSNRYLAQQILSKNGLLISEFPPKYPTFAHNFIKRNRIIAAISKVTLITEAKQKSGSLITANYAIDYNREICAIPGNINQVYSQGTNLLISKGANLVNSAEDILNLYNFQNINQTYKPENQNEKIILNLLKKQISLDELYESCKLPEQVINSTLSILELKGIIKKHKDHFYII